MNYKLTVHDKNVWDAWADSSLYWSHRQIQLLPAG